MAQKNKANKVHIRIRALQKASQAKRQQTFSKVTDALRIMKEKNLPMNFRSIAKLAGISKTWLYAQPKLKAQIERARNVPGKIRRMIDLQPKLNSKENEINILKRKNTQLKETIKKLRHQVEVVYGELYKLKHEQKKKK